jgi:polyisoprenoid-binding protein YceI
MKHILLLLAATLCAQPALAADWVINAARSSISFSGTHAGKAFTGSFGKWSGQIRFDPAKPAASKVVVLVDLASAKTGNAMYDGTLPKDDWFDTAKMAQGRFETTSITATGKNAYTAQGFLTLRGVRVPVTMPFTLSISGKQAVMQGRTSVKRMAFGIGKDSDSAGAWVSLDIPITVNVTATQK